MVTEGEIMEKIEDWSKDKRKTIPRKFEEKMFDIVDKAWIKKN